MVISLYLNNNQVLSMNHSPTFTLLEATHWQDYELLDSGDGLKLERFGKYIFARHESQAMW